jgi:hypothetical protein
LCASPHSSAVDPFQHTKSLNLTSSQALLCLFAGKLNLDKLLKDRAASIEKLTGIFDYAHPKLAQDTQQYS